MRVNARQIFGALVLLLGLALLLEVMHVWVFGSLVATFWPVLIVGAGVLAWVNNPRQWIWPALIVLVGVILQLQRLGVLQVGFWQVFLPLVLITFGLSVLAGRGGQGVGEFSGDDVDLFVAFSGVDAKNISQHFRGGKITALFGGAKLDLSKARLPERAELDVLAMFGGTEIRVPEGWAVRVSGLPLFGGWEDKTLKPADGAPVLDVRGTALFGGVEVRN